MHDHSALPGFVLVQDVRTVRRAFFATGNTTAAANATADAGAPSLADASAPIMRLLGALDFMRQRSRSLLSVERWAVGAAAPRLGNALSRLRPPGRARIAACGTPACASNATREMLCPLYAAIEEAPRPSATGRMIAQWRAHEAAAAANASRAPRPAAAEGSGTPPTAAAAPPARSVPPLPSRLRAKAVGGGGPARPLPAAAAAKPFISLFSGEDAIRCFMEGDEPKKCLEQLFTFWRHAKFLIDFINPFPKGIPGIGIGNEFYSDGPMTNVRPPPPPCPSPRRVARPNARARHLLPRRTCSRKFRRI